MTGARVTKTTEFFRVARSTVAKVISPFEQGKASSLKQNSGRKRKLSYKSCRTLKWIVWKEHKNTAPKITAEVNDHLENPVSSTTVMRELHKDGFYGGGGCN